MLKSLSQEYYPLYIEPKNEDGPGVIDERDHLVRKTQSSAEVVLSCVEDSLSSQKPIKQMSILLNPIEALNESNWLQKALSGGNGEEQLDLAFQNLKIFSELNSSEEAKVSLAQDNVKWLKETIALFPKLDFAKVFVHFDLSDFTTGERKLDEETLDSIIEQAFELRAEEEANQLREFDNFIESVRLAAKGNFYFNDADIEKRFQISNQLQRLPENKRLEKKNALQRVINEAFIAQELRNKGKLTMIDDDESTLLSHLGFYTLLHMNYFNKDYLYNQILQNFKNELKDEIYNAPLQEVCQKIQDCVLRTRLKEVKITDELQITKFKKGFDLFKEIRKEFLSKCKEYPLALPDQFPLSEDSINLKKIRRDFEENKATLIDDLIFRTLFQDKKWLIAFNNPKCDLKQFNRDIRLQYLLQRDQMNNVLAGLCQVVATWPNVVRPIKFFMKWGNYLKAELIQGFEDGNEILGEGVCWGTVQRMRLNAQRLDSLTLKEFLGEVHLQASDRYLQALYACAFRLKNLKTPLLPQKILKQYEYQEDRQVLALMRVTPEGSFKHIPDELKIGINKMDYLRASNGWLSAGLQGASHAILMRLFENGLEDPHYAWLMDPNFGLFAFEEGHSFDETIDLYGEFLNDLIVNFYPSSYGIIANQLIEKSAVPAGL